MIDIKAVNQRSAGVHVCHAEIFTISRVAKLFPSLFSYYPGYTRPSWLSPTSSPWLLLQTFLAAPREEVVGFFSDGVVWEFMVFSFCYLGSPVGMT